MWITIFWLYWNFSDNIVFQEQNFHKKHRNFQCAVKINLIFSINLKKKTSQVFNRLFEPIHGNAQIETIIRNHWTSEEKKTVRKTQRFHKMTSVFDDQKKFNLRRYWSLKWSLTQVTKLYYFQRNCESWVYVAMSRWIPAKKNVTFDSIFFYGVTNNEFSNPDGRKKPSI